jgi:hypothetical protein
VAETHTTYRFDSLWHLDAPLDRVFAALADVEGYEGWWPQVRAIHRIDADTGRVRIRSLLPYTLDLVLTRTVQDEPPGILRVDIDGDLQGWCAWQIIADGAGTLARFSQEVEVTVPMLQRAPLAVRPLLRGNHTHMMRSGERGLRAHLT